MDIADFEKEHNVRVLPKHTSRIMRAAGFLLKPFTPKFMTNFWTTIRLPFNKATIYYPSNVADPLKYMHVLEHELIHAKDMSTSWGLFKVFWLYFLLPLPIIFSGRWHIERKAYLHNILNHNYNIDAVVNSLWANYLWCWPKPLMKKWFLKKKELGNGRNK